MNVSILVGIIVAILIGLYLYRKFSNNTAEINNNENATQNNENEAKNNNGVPSPNWICLPYGYGYGDTTPLKSYDETVAVLGQPTGRNDNSVSWDQRALASTPYKKFDRVEIRNEQIMHNKPFKHTDCLYTFMKYYIPMNKVANLCKISENISYNSATEEMRIRCHHLKANTVYHWIVKQYVEENLVLDEAVGMFGPMVNEIMEDKSNDKVHQLLEEL